MTLYIGSQKVCPVIKKEVPGILREISSTGVFQMPANNFTYKLPKNATDMGWTAFRYGFNGNSHIVKFDCSSLTRVSGGYAFERALNNSSGLLEIDFSNLETTSGDYAFAYAFYGTSSLLFAGFPKLQTIGGNYIFSAAFQNSGIITLNFPELVSITGSYALQSMCSGCSHLTTVNVPKLRNVSFAALMQAFSNCTSLTSLSFPSLYVTSSTSNAIFRGMLGGITGCTVHFPSNTQSIIESWGDTTSGYSGTNTVILFDLPPTT